MIIKLAEQNPKLLKSVQTRLVCEQKETHTHTRGSKAGYGLIGWGTKTGSVVTLRPSYKGTQKYASVNTIYNQWLF